MASIKGTALLPAVKLIRKFQDKLDPKTMSAAGKALLAQRILPGSWYPLEAASQIMIAVNRILGNESLSVGMEFIGGELAEMDLRGVYQHLVTVGDVARSPVAARSSGTTISTRERHHPLLDPKTISRGMTREVPPGIPRCSIPDGGCRPIAGEGKTCDVKQMHCTLRGSGLRVPISV
jgi:hypothetical protein